MNPTDPFMAIFSNLMPGLQLDVTTLLSGIFIVGFIMMGIDYLLEGFNSAMQGRMRNKLLSRSRELYEEIYPDGDFDTFEKKRRLNRYMNKLGRF